MKKLILLFLFSIASIFSNSQKIVYVDTRIILDQMPQYQQAKERLEKEVEKWKVKISDNQRTLDSLKSTFENEKILLTEDQQKVRWEEVSLKDKELKEYIEQKFGVKGELITLRQNFAKPVQNQIWNAINTLAKKENYGMIFDKSSEDTPLIFSDPKYDITEKVLNVLKGDNKKTTTKTTTKSSTDKKASSSKKTSSSKNSVNKTSKKK